MKKRASAPCPLRVLIVEDHAILRRGLRDILMEEFPDALVGEAEDSRAALQTFRHQQWDVVLLDINIPGRDGLNLLGDMCRIRRDVKVLMVSAYPEEEFAVRAFKLGAVGYLGKNETPEKLVEAVNKILIGGTYVNTTLAERLATALAARNADRAPHEALSIRELQVLRLIAEGKTVKKIAGELSLSEKTIATYRARIAAKTGLSSNVQLTRYAFQHDLTR